MSIGTPVSISVRIEAARPDSPIAVFRCDEFGKLDAIYANTVGAQRRINFFPEDLVGIYYGAPPIKLAFAAMDHAASKKLEAEAA